VLFQVVGKDPDEVGVQLVLACLHRISIDDLRALHKQALKRVSGCASNGTWDVAMSIWSY
jgi:hypothetical protein